MRDTSLRLTDPLKPHQLAVLRWISDGCPRDVLSGTTYKHTARALHDRKLVVVSRAGGSWTATLTDTGRRYLQHGTFPKTSVPPPRSAADAGARRVSSRVTIRRRRSSPTPLAVADTPSKSRTPPLSPTEQLVADVVAAGGTLDRSRDRFNDGRRLAELVRVANRHRKPPAGKRLRHEVVSTQSGFLGPSVDRLTLEDALQSVNAPLSPVPILDTVGRYHGAVSALRKQGRPDVSAAVRSRALRLLHALAVEAERRGYGVMECRPKPTTDHRTKTAETHLQIRIGDDVVPLHLGEEQDRVEHVPTARELAEQRRYSWTRIPTHDRVPNGRLRIELGGSGSPERRSFWADRASWQLEDKLPEVLREVAVRAEEAHRRREARARAELEYQAAVEREQERARVRAAEAHRQTLLTEQLQAWREVRELRRYAAAVMQRIDQAQAGEAVDAEAVDEARQWAAWITEAFRATVRCPA